MNNRDYGLWLIPFLAVLAISYPLPSGKQPSGVVSPPFTSSQPIQSSDQNQVALSKYTAESLIRAYTGQGNEGNITLPSNSVEFLIATVPDPRDSSLAHLFDENLAAIERAMEAADYVLDRFELPWLEKGQEQQKQTDEGSVVVKQAPTGIVVSEIKEQKKDSKNARVLPVHQREPGVILFRNTNDPARLFVVFLVGETPTAGVHKAALKNALNQAVTLCKEKIASDNCKYIFRLLAPTFSGSKDSILNAFSSWHRTTNRPSLMIISGGATAIDQDSFEEELEGIDIIGSFHSTLITDKQALEAFVKFLGANNISLSQVAILTEGNTAFGFKVREQEKMILSLTYPLHISQLRTAAEKAKAAGTDVSFEAPQTRPRDLRLSLEEGSSPNDVITNLSPFETFSTELVLSNLLATISREGIHYVGLFSTDIRDQIFLARTIRKRAPNTVLFVFGADLLYLHSDVNMDFEGMLLVSTYPLFSMNQVWTRPSEGRTSRLQFPNHFSQGVYNAIVELIGRANKRLEYGMPFSPQAQGPALWLSAVGKNDLWPIRVLNDRIDSSDNADVSNVADVLAIYSKPLVFVLVLLNLLSIVASLSLISDFCPSRLSNRKVIKWVHKKLRWWLKLLGDAVFSEHRFQRRAYLFAFSVSVLLFCFVSVSIFLRFVRFSASPELLWILLLVLASLAFVLASLSTVLIGSGVLSAFRSDRFSSILSLLAFVLFPSFIFGLAVLYAIYVQNSLNYPLFYHLRTVNIESGLSPLLPLFFVGGGAILWTVCSLRRLRMLEELLGPQLNNPPQVLYLGHDSSKTLRTMENHIKRLLESHPLSLPFWGVIVVLVGVPCFIFFVLRLIPSIEGPFFYLFFGSSFFMVYMGLSFTFWRFLWVWWETHRLLRYLSWHPISDVCRDFAKGNGGMPKMDLSAAFMPYAVLKFSLNKAYHCSIFTGAKNIEKILEAAANADANGDWQVAVEHRSAAQKKLSETASLVEERLQMVSDSRKDLIQRAQSFFAAQIVVFLHHVLSHLQNLIFFVVMGLLLMLLAINYYPFQPREGLLWFNWLIILTTISLSLVVFVQMGRDRVLSLLSDTPPGQVTWNREFVLRILLYVIVPVLVLLGAQFPEGMKQMLSWVSSFQKTG